MCAGVGDKTPTIFHLKIMAAAAAYSTQTCLL